MQTPKYRVLLLPSSDGFEYTVAVMLPWHATVEKAVERIEEIIKTYKTDTGEQWDYEGMVAVIESAGYALPQIVHGEEYWNA